MKMSVAVLAAIVAIASPCRAQDSTRDLRSDFSRLQQQLRPGDDVVVSTERGTTIRGRMAGLSSGQITVIADHEPREIPAEQITRVQRRRNGILLGTVIGAAAGVPFGLALKSYAHNEDFNETTALLFPIAVGVGTGIAIDAFLVSPKTVFERAPATRAHLSIAAGPKRVSAQVTIRP